MSPPIVEGYEPGAEALELVVQESAVGRVAGGSIRILCNHHADAAAFHEGTRLIQSGTLKIRCAPAFVADFLEDLVTLSCGPPAQSPYLLV